MVAPPPSLSAIAKRIGREFGLQLSVPESVARYARARWLYRSRLKTVGIYRDRLLPPTPAQIGRRPGWSNFALPPSACTVRKPGRIGYSRGRPERSGRLEAWSGATYGQLAGSIEIKDTPQNIGQVHRKQALGDGEPDNLE